MRGATVARTTNPYCTDGPVGGTPAFVGRSGLVVRLVDALETHGGALLVGLPGSGRTSVLQEVVRTCEARGRLHAVSIDLTAMAWEPLEVAIRHIADEVASVLRVTDPALGAYVEEGFNRRWLPRVLERLDPDDRVALVFDAWPLGRNPLQPTTHGRFLTWLSGLLHDHGDRLVVLVTTDLREPAQERYVRDVLPAVPRLALAPLTRAEVGELVGASADVRWKPAAVDRLHRLTGGHARLTQAMARLVWSRCVGGEGRVTVARVEAAVVELLKVEDVLLEGLWTGLPPAARVVVGALSWHDDEVPETSALPAMLQAAGVVAVTHALAHDSLRALQRQGLLDARRVESRLVMPMELLRLWVRARRPLEQVLPELDHIDAAAERGYREAEHLWRKSADGGDARDVVARLEGVLDQNPNHAAATELLAGIRERAGELDSAVRLYRQLHGAQPTRVRAALVRVLLAQADTADTPLRALQCVDEALEVAPNHVEARARRAALAPAAQAAVLQRPEPSPPAEAPVSVAVVEEAPDDRALSADDLDRLYLQGLAALERGDRPAAQQLLGEVAAVAPDFRETPRHLYRAVHGVEPQEPASGAWALRLGMAVGVVGLGVAAASLLVATVFPAGTVEPLPAQQPTAVAAAPALPPVASAEPATHAPPDPEPAPDVAPDATRPLPPPPLPSSIHPVGAEPSRQGATPASHPGASLSELLTQGAARWAAGDAAGAAALFDAAVTVDPTSAAAHLGLARAEDGLKHGVVAHVHYCAAKRHGASGADIAAGLTGLGRSCDTAPR